MRRSVAASLVLTGIFISPQAVQAQATERACGTQAAAYANQKGFRLWVTRKGSLARPNPLRPLSPDQLTVLQVAVNGRLATAYGPDADNLRQGPAPQRLERESGTPIAWLPGLTDLPEGLRVVAEDGAVLLGPLTFVECGDAPKVAPVADAKPPVSRGRHPAPTGLPPGLSMPKGALPEGALR